MTSPHESQRPKDDESVEGADQALQDEDAVTDPEAEQADPESGPATSPPADEKTHDV